MGDAVGATIEVLLQTLIAVSVEEIGLIKNFSNNLKRLKKSAGMIRNFLEDAETRQVKDKSVQRWMRNLEAVAFDADYVMDELNYEVLRKKVQKLHMKKKVRCFFPNCKSLAFRHRMARKIKDIVDELKSINEEASGLQLLQLTRTDSLPQDLLRRETDSLTIDPDIVGRDNVVTEVVEIVKNSPTDKKLSVISIVGMGGLGKTTLARKVFHEIDIISSFEKRIWVYVSQDFDPVTVFKCIFESLTGEKIDGSREVVLRKLQENIGDKRYFLVLDDLWNEDAEKWDNFITSLEQISPLKGNVILITTRKRNVASIVKSNHIHDLAVLSNEECWRIIKAKASGKENIPSNFETIGLNIAKKCGGLPLAAKVVGSFLCQKSEEEWQSVEKKWFSNSGQNEEDMITKILKLSFDNLPSPSIKKCFAFYSFLPKGSSVKKDEIIHLWMAEGLVQTDEEKEGNKVFDVLLQSSLLQVQGRDWLGNVTGFGMHDLVHDVASSLLNSKSDDGVHQVRYISTDKSTPISDEHAKCLRALFFNGEICNTLFSNLTRLHVLILNDGEMKELPVEIEKLICLRLLDISNTKIVSLPDSIGKLYHLQTLRATKDKYGSLEKLPHTFKFLVNLSYLYIPNIELPPEIGRLSSLQILPYFKVSNEEGSGITELGSLHNLKGGIEIHNLEKVRDKDEAKSADLFHKPCILNLKLVWNESREDYQSNDEDVLEGLQPHWNLKNLEIKGFKGTSFPLWTLKMEVREDVENRWIKLENLLSITLSHCKVCEEIPMMGHLPRLKSLYLNHLSRVKCIESSFYGIPGDDVDKGTISAFPALEKLELIHLENLTTWTEMESAFCHLEYLKIDDCRQLNCAPSQFPCLKELEIENMESGLPLASICGSKLTTLVDLKIRKVDGLVCLPDGIFSSNKDLVKLEITYCHNLLNLVPWLGGGGASLRELRILYCSNLEELPEDIHNLNALEELIIYGSPKLKSIAYPSGGQISSPGLSSLRRLSFIGCSGLTNVPCEMLESCALSLEELYLWGLASLRNLPQVMRFLHKLPHLESLDISFTPRLGDVGEIGSFCRLRELRIGGASDMRDYECFEASVGRILAAMPSLTSLTLNGMEEWDALPHQLQHLTNLSYLDLNGFGIEVLPEWLGRLSSLEILGFENCKKLKQLASKEVMQGLAKLDEFGISGCPLLKQNLEQKESHDSEWSKISHIRRTYIL